MYSIQASYTEHDYLRILHTNIKPLQFIISTPQITLEDAYELCIEYINTFFSVIPDKTKQITKLDVTPKTSKEWRKYYDLDIVATEDRHNWKITCWKKVIHKGYFYNAVKFEEIFHLNILQGTNEISSLSLSS